MNLNDRIAELKSEATRLYEAARLAEQTAEIEVDKVALQAFQPGACYADAGNDGGRCFYRLLSIETLPADPDYRVAESQTIRALLVRTNDEFGSGIWFTSLFPMAIVDPENWPMISPVDSREFDDAYRKVLAELGAA